MSKNKDNLLETFIAICDAVANVSSYISKSNILRDFFQKGIGGKAFKGDIKLWINMLLPSDNHRVYNLQNKQIVKLFSRIFRTNLEEMLIDLEQGDVSETIRKYFLASKVITPQDTSTLALKDVDTQLVNLTKSSKEDYQTEIFTELCKKATADDLKMIIRLIKQDLKINAKARHVLDAFGPEAYAVYQASRDLDAVVDQFASSTAAKSPVKAKKTAATSSVSSVQLMTPISPMLASACNSVETAFKKSPEGLYSEIKYDGERVQIHKQGNDFRFFSRNLKPVMEHKVRRFKEVIPQAFPTASDIIIDGEIILVDCDSGELLPFGTLGVHKKQEHRNAEVCLFIFDCIHFNGRDLRNVTLRERRKILEANLTPIKSYVQLSESHFLKTKSELAIMTAKVLKAGMEGIVLKAPSGLYQPGKRGWLKVKKDYLFEGKMADTADLVVLGGWFGSGKKGGMLSIYLMGCLDKDNGFWKTVTKVHSGLDDATMEEIHNKLINEMERSNANKLPSWLICNKPLLPDYIAKSPDKMPVWEITGAEFTNSNAHTANGISIRFPRITKIRNDKSPKEATNLQELQKLFAASKDNVNVDLLLGSYDDGEDDVKIKTSLAASPMKKIKVQEEENPTAAGSSPKGAMLASIKKEKPSVKRETSDENEGEALSFQKKKKRRTDIFIGFMAYFRTEEETRLHECLCEFEENGGEITLDRKKANIVLYEKNEFVESIRLSRQYYQPECRHLKIKWMFDSIRDGKAKAFPEYAILLKN